MNKVQFVEEVLKSTKAKFFTIKFTKKDGSEREMVAQVGVTKFLKKDAPICANGSTNTVAHIAKYMTVYDVQKKQYRNVNMETLSYFKCGEVEMHLDK